MTTSTRVMIKRQVILREALFMLILKKANIISGDFTPDTGKEIQPAWSEEVIREDDN